MAKPYFSQVPNFLYVNRAAGNRTISNYTEVKNLFKRARLREDIYSDLSFFTKYKIIGDDRPDNVAEKLYDDPTLDWIVLLSNNILNIQTEWPLSQYSYNNFLIEKYGSDSKLQEIHHYECTGVKNSKGVVITEEGLTMAQDFSVTYLDPNPNIGSVTATGITKAVTNLEYENKIQDAKRNIFTLKPEYLNVIYNDLEDIMEYKKGSTQYISGTLKLAENIKLYQ